MKLDTNEGVSKEIIPVFSEQALCEIKLVTNEKAQKLVQFRIELSKV